MGLTLIQKEEIKKKLNAVWTSSRCPRCGKGWEHINDFLTEIKEYSENNLPAEQKIAPVIVLSCLVCGHVTYISPHILKITGFE